MHPVRILIIATRRKRRKERRNDSCVNRYECPYRDIGRGNRNDIGVSGVCRKTRKEKRASE